MRSMWNGAVVFGLVSVPVKMYAATEDHDIHFHQVHRDCGARVKYVRRCTDGHEVEYRDVSKGYELADGREIVVEPEDLSALSTEASREIRVSEFVPADRIDPLLIDKAYYLGPGKGGSTAYALLRAVLGQTRRVAVVKVQIRQREQLAVLRVLRRCLVLQTLLWPDEVRSTDEIAELAAVIEPVEDDPMLAQAETLIGTMVADFDPGRYSDEYTAAVQGLIDARRAALPEPALTPAGSADAALMAELTASIGALAPAAEKKTRRKTKKEN
jgi:DNA end-binding protein Ku